VRTRTYLTTPPGLAPSDSTGGSGPHDERYLPALDLPVEPRVPGRHRRLLVTLALVAGVLVIGAIAFRLTTASQAEDPAMTDPAQQQQSEDAAGAPAAEPGPTPPA
jgi:hypothetical protein